VRVSGCNSSHDVVLLRGMIAVLQGFGAGSVLLTASSTALNFAPAFLSAPRKLASLYLADRQYIVHIKQIGKEWLWLWGVNMEKVLVEGVRMVLGKRKCNWGQGVREEKEWPTAARTSLSAGRTTSDSHTNTPRQYQKLHAQSIARPSGLAVPTV